LEFVASAGGKLVEAGECPNPLLHVDEEPGEAHSKG
jgi:hypothetical protein